MDITLLVVADYANVTVDGKLHIMGIFKRVRYQTLWDTLRDKRFGVVKPILLSLCMSKRV